MVRKEFPVSNPMRMSSLPLDLLPLASCQFPSSMFVPFLPFIPSVFIGHRSKDVHVRMLWVTGLTFLRPERLAVLDEVNLKVDASVTVVACRAVGSAASPQSLELVTSLSWIKVEGSSASLLTGGGRLKSF